ncbi:MAG: hypothetical protein IJ806_07405 [Ruminococcus sp.]|nr:hypothetical protein [Ruminococcus sp.]
MTYDSEEITVIYTRAEMKVKSNTRVNVTGKQAKVVQESTLYDTDESFAKACTFEEDCDLVDTAGQPYEQSSPLGKLSATNTDSVTYTVENGKLIKHIDRFIDYTCEAVKVVYTRAELSSAPQVLRGDIDGNARLDHLDVSLMISMINQEIVFTPEQMTAAELDGTDGVTYLDLSVLIDLINGESVPK